MKNWIIVLLVFVVPLGLYSYFEHKNINVPQIDAVAVENNQGARIVKFYSPMCSDCVKISKEMKKILPKYKDTILFEEINVSEQTDKNKDMIKKYNITLVPTLLFLDKNGNLVKKIEGYAENVEIEANIAKIK